MDGATAYSQIVSVQFGRETRLSLYPNPVKDRLNLDYSGSNATFQVFDAMGRLVISQAQTEQKQTKISLDLSQLSEGTYWLHVIDNEQMLTQKFVKKGE